MSGAQANRVRLVVELFWVLLVALNASWSVDAREESVVRSVQATRYDYFADILITPPNNQEPFICGGTLIRSDIVMTAAQCFVEGGTASVRVGSSSRNNNNDDAQLPPRIEALALTPHPEYAFGFEHDIMLLKLREPVTDIAPVRLNTNAAVPEWQQRLALFGFGARSEMNLAPSEVLVETEVVTSSFVRCNRQYLSRLNETMHICTIGPSDGAEDACEGDGGAPLIIKGEDASSDVQVGIVSFGFGCGRADSFSGHTSVAAYSQFILEFTCLVSVERRDDCPERFNECFSGNSIVQTLERGPMQLTEVKIGDHVMVGPNQYEPIYSFGHYLPNAKARFLEISTTAKTTLQVSSDHLVFVPERPAPIPASMLRVGDEMMDSTGTKISILSIKTTVATGVFAPFTPSGKIVVDDILSSTFVTLGGSESLDLFGTTLSYHWISHTFESLHRIVCYRLGSCLGETYTDEGISHWAATPHKFFLWILRQPTAIRHLVFSPILAALVLLYAIEQWPVLLILCVLCVLLSRRFRTRKMKVL